MSLVQMPQVEMPDVRQLECQGVSLVRHFRALAIRIPSRAILTTEDSLAELVDVSDSEQELGAQVPALHDAGCGTDQVGKGHLGNECSPRGNTSGRTSAPRVVAWNAEEWCEPRATERLAAHSAVLD